MKAPVLVLAMALVLVAGCKRHDPPERSFVSTAEEARDLAPRLRAGPVESDTIFRRIRSLPQENPLYGDRHAIQEGRRLYRWMNCIGCHAEGGGSIGPSLWDDDWRYGGSGQDIAESILYGRPDGMPAFAQHLPEDQLWKLVAYVQAMTPRGGYYRHGVK